MRSSLLVIGILGVAAAGAPPDQFTQLLLENAYREYTPAIGLLEYSSEVVNPASGETTKRESNALALVVSPDGLVMTHGHMVLENTQPFNIKVTLGRGDEEHAYDAALLKKPDDVNVVFLRLQSDLPLDLPYVRFSAENDLRVGSPVALFGMLGDSLDYVRSMQESRVAAVIEKPRTTYCLTDNVRFGFVGGPVVDTLGRVVGVLGFDLSRNEGGDLYVRSGHPLVYQTALFRKYIEHPPSETALPEANAEAWLGVFTQPLTDELAEYWGLRKDGGLVVSTVVTPSPAAAVGLQPGDVIVEFNGVPIAAKLDREVLGFTKLVREVGAGREVEIKILRQGRPETIRVTLGTRPRTSRDADEYEDPIFGITLREITTDLRIALNLSEDVKGVIVRRVKSGGTAQLGGLRPGVIILTFGGFPVENLDDYQAAVEKVRAKQPDEVAVFARVGPATGFFRLQPRWEQP